MKRIYFQNVVDKFSRPKIGILQEVLTFIFTEVNEVFEGKFFEVSKNKSHLNPKILSIHEKPRKR